MNTVTQYHGTEEQTGYEDGIMDAVYEAEMLLSTQAQMTVADVALTSLINILMKKINL